MSQLILKNTLAQIIARVLVVFFSFFLVRLLINYLGRDGYGIYSFVIAVVVLFATISDWGTNIIGVREAAQNRKKQKEIFSSVLFARLLFSIAALLLVNLMVRFYSPWREFITPITIASFVLIFLSIKTSLGVIFQTLLRLELNALVEVVGSISFFLLTLFFLKAGGDVNWVLTGWIISAIIASLSALILNRRFIRLEFRFNLTILGTLLRESLPMGTLLLVFSVYNKVDVIILEHFQGVGEVAVYSLAYKIHENLVLGAAFLMNATFPLLARLYREEKKEELRLFYRKIFGLLGIGGVTLGFIFFIFAPFIISLLAGGQLVSFTGSIMALRILLFATFISFLNHLTGYSLVAFGKQKLSLLIGIFALVGNLASNILFIPRFSWTAAAAITVLTEFFVFLASSVVLWKIIGIVPKPIWFLSVAKELLRRRGKIFSEM